MNNSFWHGKSALICGASSGLGLAIATELAQQQTATLFLVARNANRLEHACRQLSAVHPTVKICQISADFAKASDVEAIAQELELGRKKLDLVVQAIGESDRGRLCDLTADRLIELLRVNVVPGLNVLRILQPLLKKPGCRVVMIGSLASLFTPRYLGGYAAAKHAVAALAGQARLELAGDGIHVMLACPGPIQRGDSGTRYRDNTAASGLPPSAMQPGGGAKISGLEPQQLARDILKAAEKRQNVLIRPRSARLLTWIYAFSTRLGDWILRRKSS